MKRKLSYAIVIALCGMMGFTSCTKDYDDDLRIHREMIENNETSTVTFNPSNKKRTFIHEKAPLKSMYFPSFYERTAHFFSR